MGRQQVSQQMPFREKVLQSNQVLYTFHPTPHSHALQSVCPRFNSNTSIRTCLFVFHSRMPEERQILCHKIQQARLPYILHQCSRISSFKSLLGKSFFLIISWLRSNTYQLEEFLLDSKQKKEKQKSTVESYHTLTYS